MRGYVFAFVTLAAVADNATLDAAIDRAKFIAKHDASARQPVIISEWAEAICLLESARSKR